MLAAACWSARAVKKRKQETSQKPKRRREKKKTYLDPLLPRPGFPRNKKTCAASPCR